MSLEQWSKISDIIFKGVLATAIAIAGLIFTAQKNSDDMVRQCDAIYATLVDYASKTKFDDKIKQHIAFRISNYNRICNPPLDNDQTQSIISMLIIDPQTIQPDVREQTASASIKGWVALARIPSPQYEDVNFDTVTGKGQFKVGDLLKSRWTVNVREKNTPVLRGDNPILAILDAGACVKVEERVTGQFNEWARIIQERCPF